MSFAVQIISGVAQVEPGNTATVEVEISNTGLEPASFELEIEGLDAEWTAIPVPSVTIKAGEKSSERIFIKPPRTSESSAGTYPFVVKVRSLEDGEQKTAQGVLELKSFHNLSLDLNPRKVALSPFSKDETVQITVLNLGNSEHTIHLFANDPDDLFAFEFESEQITLGPGQQREVEMTVTATKSALFANPRLQPFTLTGRSVDMPSVAATTQGQIEQKALLTPGVLIALVFVLALAAAWWFARPKPPTVDNLTVSPNAVEVGNDVIVTWSASNAKSVTLTIGKETFPNEPLKGTKTFHVTEEGQLIVDAQAIRDSEKSDHQKQFATVTTPVIAPKPTISKFSTDRKTLKVGEPFIISYKVSDDTVRVSLSPPGIELDPRAESKQLTADVPGEFTYKLIAYNKDGGSTEKEVKINVVDASLAEITEFAPSPKEVDPAVSTKVVISWKLKNGRKAELKVGNADPITIDFVSGSQEIEVFEETIVTITVYDENGKPAIKSLTIKMKREDPPTQTTGTGTTGSITTTTGGGTTGGTTGDH
jgi:hypothetical protein